MASTRNATLATSALGYTIGYRLGQVTLEAGYFSRKDIRENRAAEYF